MYRVPWLNSLPLGGRVRERGSKNSSTPSPQVLPACRQAGPHGRGNLAWLLALGIFLSACTKEGGDLHPLTLLSPAGQRIELRVEIVDDDAERSRGLMFREELPVGHGMLFVFDRPHILSFWMKNTHIPLDILFFDTEGLFVSTATMEPCRSYPCPMYTSAAEAQYALEVPKGSVEMSRIGEKWELTLPEAGAD